MHSSEDKDMNNWSQKPHELLKKTFMHLSAQNWRRKISDRLAYFRYIKSSLVFLLFKEIENVSLMNWFSAIDVMPGFGVGVKDFWELWKQRNDMIPLMYQLGIFLRRNLVCDINTIDKMNENYIISTKLRWILINGSFNRSDITP